MPCLMHDSDSIWQLPLHKSGELQELVFGERKVEAVISEVVTERLSKQQYDPITGTQVEEFPVVSCTICGLLL